VEAPSDASAKLKPMAMVRRMEKDEGGRMKNDDGSIEDGRMR
jgi:hypothetical protein